MKALQKNPSQIPTVVPKKIWSMDWTPVRKSDAAMLIKRQIKKISTP